MSTPYQNFDEYGLRYYPTHLADLDDGESLVEVLTDFDFLQTKLNSLDISALIADYDLYPQEETLRLVGDALQLSAHVLVRDKNQLAGQLVGRLSALPDEQWHALLEAARSWSDERWFCPLQPDLTPPGGDVSNIVCKRAASL